MAGTPRNAAPAADEPQRDEVDEASIESMDASDPPSYSGITGVGAAEPTGDERQERIASRAHELWREAGCPEGVALDFWLQAERDVDTAERGEGG